MTFVSKNRLGLLAAVGTAALALAATTGAYAQSSGTLTIAVPQDPTTLDPQMHRVRHSQTIAHTMMDKLFYQPPPGIAFGPLLAESITQVDDTHYEVKIREGVKFHNGDELTSADVVYTYQRLWDPANKSPRATMGNMPNIVSIEAVDKYTIRWTTKVSFGTVDVAQPALGLSNQEILHKASYEKLTLEQAQSTGPIGVGPFKFVEWIPEQRLVMEAFGDYWQGAPGVKSLIWRAVPEESTRVAELLAGSVDIIYPVTPDFVPQLKAAGMTLEIVPGTSARMLQMNVREGSPFADVEVRKAMNMAIDKVSITDNLYQGLAIPFEQVPGVGQEGHIEGYDPFPYDPEAARAVLSKVTEPIELFTTGQNELAAEAISEQLRGYGMNVTTVVLDSAAASQQSDEGTFDLVLYSAGYGSGDFIGTYFGNNFECSRLKANQVRTGFCEPSLDEKANAIRVETDPAKRAAQLDELVKLLSEEYVPWVPLFGPTEVWGLRPNVKSFTGSSAGQFFDLWKVTVDK
jgi:peptide/nickel transport system substrate-binding protein